MSSWVQKKPFAGTVPAPPGGETILVVDAHECLLEVAKVILSRCGYVVLTASGVQEAHVVLARGARVDLILAHESMRPEHGGGAEVDRLVGRCSAPVLWMCDNPVLDTAADAWSVVGRPFIRIDLFIQGVRRALDATPRESRLAA